MYVLALVLLVPDIPCLCKQCRYRSVDFRSQLIWICTVCHSVYEFVSTTWIKLSDWLKVRNGHGILIFSAWQWLNAQIWIILHIYTVWSWSAICWFILLCPVWTFKAMIRLHGCTGYIIHLGVYSFTLAGLGGSVGCAVRLETRRSRVQPPPRSVTFFPGDWSWNIFYGHSLPSADSRRAVVSLWWKNVHNTG